MIKTHWVRILVSCIVLGTVGCMGVVTPSIPEPLATSESGRADRDTVGAPEATEATPGTTAEVAPPSLTVAPTPTTTHAPDSGQTPGPEREMRLTPTLPVGLDRVPVTPSAPVTGEVPDALLAAVLDDAVERSDSPRDAIQVVRAEAVVWSDGSLGCPQPGMMYTQALVGGYRIVLEVDGELYDYHASERGTFFLCEGRVTDPLPTPSLVEEDSEMTPSASVSPGLQPIVDQALADLAERLSIEVEQIEVLEAKAVVWPDGSLGCPQPGLVYTQVQQEGYLIRLRVDKRVYDYHGGGYPDRGPFLCEGVENGRIVPPSPSLDGN